MVAHLVKTCFAHENENLRIGKLEMRDKMAALCAFDIGDEMGSGQVNVVTKVHSTVRNASGFIRQNLDRVAMDPALRRTIERTQSMSVPPGSQAESRERVNTLSLTVDDLGPTRDGLLLDLFQCVAGILKGPSSRPRRYAAHKPATILELLRRYRHHLETEQ